MDDELLGVGVGVGVGVDVGGGEVGGGDVGGGGGDVVGGGGGGGGFGAGAGAGGGGGVGCAVVGPLPGRGCGVIAEASNTWVEWRLDDVADFDAFGDFFAGGFVEGAARCGEALVFGAGAGSATPRYGSGVVSASPDAVDPPFDADRPLFPS